jgi:hypothetical protein
VFALLLVQDSVEVWEAPSTMLVGLRVQVKPAGETDEVSETVPVNPLTGATVIVDVAVPPTVVVTLVGLAVTVKSWTTNVTVAVCESEPLVPVTVTVKVVAVVEEHDSVDVWDAPRTMLLGVRVQVNPAGLTAEVRATVPVNPLTGATVIVEVPATPTLTVTLVGDAATVKSVKIAWSPVALWDRDPLVPVTVSV